MNGKPTPDVTNTVVVHRAQPVGGHPVLVSIIEIRPTIPDPRPSPAVLGEYSSDAVMAQDAKHIADALYASLPGGTFDRLIVLLLERKISHFVVRHP